MDSITIRLGLLRKSETIEARGRRQNPKKSWLARNQTRRGPSVKKERDENLEIFVPHVFVLVELRGFEPLTF
jgi:hypothetical protein